MRYFDQTLIANHREHAGWWAEVNGTRDWFHHTEDLRHGV